MNGVDTIHVMKFNKFSSFPFTYIGGGGGGWVVVVTSVELRRCSTFCFRFLGFGWLVWFGFREESR